MVVFGLVRSIVRVEPKVPLTLVLEGQWLTDAQMKSIAPKVVEEKELFGYFTYQGEEWIADWFGKDKWLVQSAPAKRYWRRKRRSS